MSNDQTAEPKPASSNAGTSPIRLVILLVIFGIALAGLLYDYAVARPAQKAALAKIEGLLDGSTPDPGGDGTVSDDEVRSILEREPSDVDNFGNGKTEIYKWVSGLPARSHKLYVTYAGKQMPLLHSVSTSPPTKSELPPITKVGKPPTQEELDAFEEQELELVTGPGTGGKKRPSPKQSDDANEDSEEDEGDEAPKGKAKKAKTDASEDENGDEAEAKADTSPPKEEGED